LTDLASAALALRWNASLDHERRARYRADILLDLYRAIWRVTGRQQLLLIALSMTVAALAAAPLRFQQLVVNSLVKGGGDIRPVAWLCAGILARSCLVPGSSSS
jgi:hypothetical protein